MQRRFAWAVTFVVTAIVAIFMSQAMAIVGGLSDVKDFENSVEINELARFAVEEHKKQQNADLSFVRVTKAQQQVVAGMMYYLTVEGKGSDGNPKLYEAKVWVKPWENFKKLQDFKPAKGSGRQEGDGKLAFDRLTSVIAVRYPKQINGNIITRVFSPDIVRLCSGI